METWTKTHTHLRRTNLKGLEAQVANVFGLPEASCGSDEEKATSKGSLMHALPLAEPGMI